MVRAADTARLRAEPSAPSLTVDGSPPQRLLVVEDDGDLRELLCDLLAVEGFEAVLARDGAEALALLRSGAARPALVLLDLVMPRMNGWEFRAEQLRDPALAGVPVIAMSASHDLAGVPTLRKPFDVSAVAPLLRAAAAQAARGLHAQSAPGSTA